MIELEFGAQALALRLPAHSDVLTLPADTPLPDPAAAIRQALAQPIGTPPLGELARRIRLDKPDPAAVIVISDNTRPVPYRGPQGILMPIIEVLRAGGVGRIEILVATGTHRALRAAELRAMLPDEVFDGRIVITNHVCTDAAMLRTIGRTPSGTEISINSHYLDADLKILTGLVEPHFMAGASGGPKAVCPGLVGEPVTCEFHGAALMADERCGSLLCDDNPCHALSLAVAELAGVDFIVNVTLDGAKRLTGVYAGDVRQAHRAAIERIKRAGAIRIAAEYDLVVTHAGFAGINHYQAAKAALEASKAVKPGGTIVMAAHHTDVDPVGGANYRRLLPMLGELGSDGCVDRYFAADWTFVPEQWQVQMWARAFRKLGDFAKLVYCAPSLTGEPFVQRGIPGRDGGAGLPCSADERAFAELMVQRAVDDFMRAHPAASVAVLADGPYGVPIIND
jgi:nickel-dependent lactate racemase